MERQGLVRGVRVPVDEQGGLVEQNMEIVPRQYVPPMGGIRTLTGSVIWAVTTQLSEGRLLYRNVITTEQGYSNGQGPLTDYRTSEATIEGEVSAETGSLRPPIVEAYTTTRGNRVMIGFIRP